MYDDYPEPRFLLPLVLAIAVHVLTVVGLMHSFQEKPKPKVIILEASVINAKESARLQSAANAQKAQADKTNEANATASKSKQPNTAQPKASTTAQAEPTQSADSTQTTNKPTPSAHISEYNERLAKREQEYAKELASYTKSLDRQIALDIEKSKQALKDAEEARLREVNALKDRAKHQDAEVRENAKAMNEAHERQKEADRQARAEKEAQNQHKAESANLASHDTPPIPNVGRGGQVGTTSNVSKAQAQSNIAGRVKAIWEQYNNPKNRHLTATIHVDDNGNLMSVSFGAGDQELRPSLEASIHKASPFPEMKGVSRSFSIKFYTD